MTKLTPDDKQALMRVIMLLEHQTDKRITEGEYLAILKLAKQCEVPDYIQNYFTNKAEQARANNPFNALNKGA